MNREDTIAAISTPPGRGGIGIVRISGPKSLNIALEIFRKKKAKEKMESIKSHKALYGEVIDPSEGLIIDETMLTFMKEPNSFTGENMVEISLHGSPVVLDRVLKIIISLGARLAEPGEFTKRAYLNKKIDLLQAEAIVELINSKTALQSKMAIKRVSGELSDMAESLRGKYLNLISTIEAELDFPEDGLEFDTRDNTLNILNILSNDLKNLLESYNKNELISSGLNVAILGATNAGKSTLFNSLLKNSRAITSEEPGTTRDFISEELNIGGIHYRLYDTAGINGKGSDKIEECGIAKTHEVADNSDLILYMIDGTKELLNEEKDFLRKNLNKEVILIINKTDIISSKRKKIDREFEQFPSIRISALNGDNISGLEEMIRFSFNERLGQINEAKTISGTRQKIEIENALESLLKAKNGLENQMSYEFIAFDLKESLKSILRFKGDISENIEQEVLDKIFSSFCIGK